MNTSQVVDGVVKPDGTLELIEKLQVPAGKVRVTVEALPASNRPSLLEVMEQIRLNQAARGYTGRTMEEMHADEAAKKAEEEEYEARWREIWSQTERQP